MPVDGTGAALLRFDGGPAAHDTVSALDVLRGRFDAKDLAGRIVFVGSSAAGLNDMHHTALDARFAGSMIEAVMAGDIVGDRFVRVPSWSLEASLTACLATGLAMAALFVSVSGVPLAVAGCALLMTTLVAGSLLLFARDGLFVSPAPGLIVALALLVLFFVTHFAFREATLVEVAAPTRERAAGNHRVDGLGRRDARPRDRRAHQAHPALRAGDRRTRPQRRALPRHADPRDHRPAVPVGAAARHRQGRRGGPHPAESRQAHARRIRADEAARGVRPVIHGTAERIDGDNFLRIAGEIAATHHEKWEGSGYPLGLAGEAIPLSGRIMAVADIYDAPISRRCYKEPFSHGQAAALMRAERGRTFEPLVLDAFFAIEEVIVAIAHRYSDEAAAPEPLLTGHALIDDGPSSGDARGRAGLSSA